MTPEQFVYWLQGYMELSGPLGTQEQWQTVNEHLQTVFIKVTPSHDHIITEPLVSKELHKELEC